ncbi:MAG: rhodanese-like domain-containing protein [Desulfobacteraceae bacterium]|nr:rhodanese-like domain-containing protein [Desulfobacteraceae bacterium]
MTPSLPHNGDRKDYHLAVIRETAAELGQTRHPGRILASFLMSAQGGLGALGGFAALTDRTSEVTHLLVRGEEKVGPEEIKGLIKNAADPAKAEPSAFFIAMNNSFLNGFALILACPLEDGRMAFLGLSPAMHGRDYDPDDRQLLISLSSLFQISLNSALFSTRVELLNAELEKRNTELDRQVFYLNGLKELSMEAGESVDVEKFLAAFLPTLLGRFSRSQGMVVLHNRASGDIWLKTMGIQPEPALAVLPLDRLLFLCLAGVENKHIQPLQAEPVVQMDPLLPLVPGFAPESAFLFLVKDQMYGTVLLGPPLEDHKFSAPEKELLSAFVAQSVLHLKNADSFAAIVALNRNLAEQNQALRDTIDELTRAEQRISVLETAARRIARMVSHNAERILQVRLLDFILIIGISIVLGVLFNLQNPKGLSFFPLPNPEATKTVAAPEALRLLSREKALLIDARPREFYELNHAPGAINVPPSLFDALYAANFNDEDPERPMVIYGRTVSRLYDEMTARKFISRDHEEVYLYLGDPRNLSAKGEAP